jgi:hypothetical protein
MITFDRMEYNLLLEFTWGTNQNQREKKKMKERKKKKKNKKKQGLNEF